MQVMTSRSVSKRTLETMGWLRRIPYLGVLSTPDLQAVAEACSRRRASAGAAIFSEGARPTGVFLILSGRVRVVRTSRDGREQLLHEEGPDATLGEVPVFDGEGYIGSAIAAESCTLLFLPRDVLLAHIERTPIVATRVIQVLSRRVRRFAGLAADLALRGTTERVAAHVLRAATLAGAADVSLSGTRAELAAELGTVREEVSRALSDLRLRGIIDVDRRRIRVRDLPRLRVAAGQRPGD
jgi:CRP/FNR family transcriptional regulator